MSVINVCGVLVQAVPRYTELVKAELESDPGVEVHTITDEGKMIVTVEKDTREQTGETLNRFQVMDHVLCTTLVYQYFDDDTEQETQQ